MWLLSSASVEWLDGLRGLVDFGLFILIWLVQLIIYPSFAFCAPEHFSRWHYRYTGLISLFVAPLMFSESGIYLWQAVVWRRWHDVLGVGLVLVIWAATLLLSVPCHDRLQQSGFDLAVIRRLVRTNWVRTCSWSLLLGIDLATGVILAAV